MQCERIFHLKLTDDVDNIDFFMVWNSQTTRAFSGRNGTLSVPHCAAFIVMSSGSSVMGPLLFSVLFCKGALVIMWLLMVLVSGVAQCMFVPGGGSDKLLIKNFRDVHLLLLFCPSCERLFWLPPLMSWNVASSSQPSARRIQVLLVCLKVNP